MSVLVDEQLSLDAAAVQRPIDTVRAALLNAKPTPVHRGDPETSWLASVAAALRASGLRQRVLAELVAAGDYGATDYEISTALDILRTTAGKRRGELAKAGLCERSEKRRTTDTGMTAVVWVATEDGKQVSAALKESGGIGGTDQVRTGIRVDAEAPEEARGERLQGSGT